MKISDRLKIICDMIKKGSYIADIGTDHAYIPIYIIKNKICDKAIATDVRKGPLERAIRNIRLYGLQDSIITRLGSGLSPVGHDEVDGAVLAGMGGYLICDILEAEKEKAKTIDYFMFQPIQAPEALREYLYKSGYKIYDERLVMEKGKIYHTMAAVHGEDTIDNDIYFEIGKKLIENNDPLLGKFINKKIHELEKIIDKTDTGDSENARMRVIECKRKIVRYKEVLQWLQGAKI